ncbi:hypothetical protein SEPCBS57363_001238 [Sporothrix epigloea]|uniref:Zn(2)-C6 fungal-type domain-containing protein n=1 Tax=Sporothrix epigloea TaxID=1892477 RepID=A0ABP0D967_9PEZI
MTPPKAIEVAAAAATAAAARKRKRRTTAGGAADDCFACSKRSVKCDRRRPYCSQCLEVGNECSGYKTQLTWGVGVASRGKLRGLSLPIAKAPPVAPGSRLNDRGPGSKRDMISSPINSRAKYIAKSLEAWVDDEAMAAAAVLSSSISSVVSRRRYHDESDLSHDRSPTISHASFPGYDYTPMSTHHSVSSSSSMQMPLSGPVPIPRPGWAAPAAAAAAAPLSPFSGSLLTEALSYHSQQQSHHSQMQSHQHISSSLDSLGDADYMSPIHHTLSSKDIPYLPSPAGLLYDNLTGHNSPVPESPITGKMIESRPTPSLCPSLIYASSESKSSLSPSHAETSDVSLSAKLLWESDSISKFFLHVCFLP